MHLVPQFSYMNERNEITVWNSVKRVYNDRSCTVIRIQNDLFKLMKIFNE